MCQTLKLPTQEELQAFGVKNLTLEDPTSPTGTILTLEGPASPTGTILTLEGPASPTGTILTLEGPRFLGRFKVRCFKP